MTSMQTIIIFHMHFNTTAMKITEISLSKQDDPESDSEA
jgi:hypothetical protein